MYFIYGILGGLVVLLLVGLGVAVGLLTASRLKPRAAEQPELTEEEELERAQKRRDLIAQQNAFAILQNYSTERAYGMMNDIEPRQHDGGGT